MNVGFWAIAVAMVLAALAFVLPPLLRRPRQLDERLAALEQARTAGVLDEAEYTTKREALSPAASAPQSGAQSASRWPVLVLALLLPLAAWLLYDHVGEPRALQPGADVANAGPADAAAPADGAAAPTLEEATSGLAERMRETPDDLGGWMLLGRAYKSMQRFADAREALANAHRIAPDDADVAVEYAEALTLASNSRRIEGEAAALLDRALAQQPTHERGLWLKGIQAYQAGDFAAAAETWERLRGSLPANADVHASLAERIADARARAQRPADAASTSPPTSLAPAQADSAGTPGARTEGAPRLLVEVDIAPDLKAKLEPNDVLYVFARAPAGPRMPVAIQRLAASALPLTVTLDDSTSMLPQMTLSSLPEVVVGARVSHSGQAVPQPGDFEVLSAPVRSNRREPLRLLIDRVVE